MVSSYRPRGLEDAFDQRESRSKENCFCVLRMKMNLSNYLLKALIRLWMVKFIKAGSIVEEEESLICQTNNNNTNTTITTNHGRLPGKACAHQSWPPIVSNITRKQKNTNA